MRVQRNFSSSSSGTSLLLGFLDVISCGFAAALILGLIFSLIQPQEAGRGAEEKPYRYFEFTVTGPASHNDRAYISPEISYRSTATDKWTRVPLKIDPVDKHWSPEGSFGFKIHFIGAAAIEGRVLSVAQANPGTPAQAFGIIISELPNEADVDVQLIYASRSSYADYVAANEPIPELVISRIVFGGKSKPDKKTSAAMQLGNMTKF